MRHLTTVYLLSFAFILFAGPFSVEAHPGRTAGDGCHYCRTNCSSWGVAWDERHCHGGYTAPTPSVPTTPTCPANAFYSGGSCVCKVGYTSFHGGCTKVPANARVINSSTDAWECYEGYEEKNGTCVQVKQEEPPKEPEVEPAKDETPVETQMTKEDTEPVVSDEDLQEIAKKAQQLSDSNTGSPLGTFFSFIVISIGGTVMYRKFKKK